jgi:hypothetical protein
MNLGRGARPLVSSVQDLYSMSAAPEVIAKAATIMDWPDSPAGHPNSLRAGTNGWPCYPSTPSSSGGASAEDPMCFDKACQGWADAWMNKRDPGAPGPGIAYILRGDKGASNTRPVRDRAHRDESMGGHRAHVMVLVPDSKALDRYPTDPRTGGRWVMWKGTPFAHLMVPVSTTRAAMMTSKE